MSGEHDPRLSVGKRPPSPPAASSFAPQDPSTSRVAAMPAPTTVQAGIGSSQGVLPGAARPDHIHGLGELPAGSTIFVTDGCGGVGDVNTLQFVNDAFGNWSIVDGGGGIAQVEYIPSGGGQAAYAYDSTTYTAVGAPPVNSYTAALDTIGYGDWDIPGSGLFIPRENGYYQVTNQVVFLTSTPPAFSFMAEIAGSSNCNNTFTYITGLLNSGDVSVMYGEAVGQVFLTGGSPAGSPPKLSTLWQGGGNTVDFQLFQTYAFLGPA